MTTAKDKLLDILARYIGTKDVMNVDFKSIDDITYERTNFSKVRGSWRLRGKKLKTPKEVDAIVDKYLHTMIP